MLPKLQTKPFKSISTLLIQSSEIDYKGPIDWSETLSWCVLLVALDTLYRQEAHTPCSSGVPGPKLNPRKILLLLRLFITAVLIHVRKGKEQERQGANTKWTRQGSEERKTKT